MAVALDWESTLREIRPFSWHLDDEFNGPQQVQLAQQLEIPLLIYTVNDLQRAAQWRSWGASGVFSDFPDRLLKKLGGAG